MSKAYSGGQGPPLVPPMRHHPRFHGLPNGTHAATELPKDETAEGFQTDSSQQSTYPVAG